MYHHQGQQQNQEQQQQQQQQQQQRRSTNDSKLQAVFSKLSGVFPRAGDLGPTHEKVSTDIIESVLTAPIPISQQWSYDHPYTAVNPTTHSGSDPTDADTISALCARLECELRAAKRTHLSCGEVLLPSDLLQRVSRDILAMAESEPCGLRGCTLYLSFEGEGAGAGAGTYRAPAMAADDRRQVRLGEVKCDPATASTFEVYLTLKQAGLGGWGSFLPQFIKNLTRGNTVMISAAYTLRKNKLYRSYIE